MPTKTDRVTAEIIEAGLSHPDLPTAFDWNSAYLAFIALGAPMSDLIVSRFARGLDSVRDASEARPLREKVAATMHRDAVAVIEAGFRYAVTMFRIAGHKPDEALGEARWVLRSATLADEPPSLGESGLLDAAQRNYTLAAGALYQSSINGRDADAAELGRDLLENVVGFVVAAAASARAVEPPD